MTRVLLGVVVLFVACQAGPSLLESAPGTAGAKVWFESSAYVMATHSAGSTFPGFYWSSTECFRVQRDELNAEQLAHLESLRLSARTRYCVADGWDYSQLAVGDESGVSATYKSHEAGNCGDDVDGGVELNFDFTLFRDAGTPCN